MVLVQATNLSKAERDELLQEIERTKVNVREYVAEHSFQSLEELQSILKGPLGVGRTPAALDWLAALNKKTYALIKQVYDSGGLDKALNQRVGRELDKLGGFPTMQGDTLHNGCTANAGRFFLPLIKCT